MYHIKDFLSSGKIPEEFKIELDNFRTSLLEADVVTKISYTIKYYVVVNGKTFCMLHCVHHKDFSIRNKIRDRLNTSSLFEAFQTEKYSISQDYFENFLSFVESYYKDIVKTKPCVKAFQLAFFKALQYSSRSYVNFFNSLIFSKLFRENFSFIHGRFAIRNFEAFPFEKKLFIRFNQLRDIYFSENRQYNETTVFDYEFNNLEKSLSKSYANSSFKAIQNIGVSKASLNRLFKCYMLQSMFKNTDLSYLYNSDGTEEYDFERTRFSRNGGTFNFYNFLYLIFEEPGEVNPKMFNKIKGYDSDLSYVISFLINGDSKHQPLENNFSDEEKEAFYQKCVDLYFYHLFYYYKVDFSKYFTFKQFYFYMKNILDLKGLSFVLDLEADININLILPNRGIKNNNELIYEKEFKEVSLYLYENRYLNYYNFSNYISFYTLPILKQKLFLKILKVCSVTCCSSYSADAILEIIIAGQEISFPDLYKFYKRIILKDQELNNELFCFRFNQENVSLFPDLFQEATGKTLFCKDGTPFIQGNIIQLFSDLDEDEIPF